MDKKKVNDRVIIAVKQVMKSRPELSKTMLSELLGVTITSFSHMMASRMNASVETMTALILQFNISADWLLTGRGGMFSEPEGAPSMSHIGIDLHLIDTIKQQAEEIGQLKERIRLLDSMVAQLRGTGTPIPAEAQEQKSASQDSQEDDLRGRKSTARKKKLDGRRKASRSSTVKEP